MEFHIGSVQWGDGGGGGQPGVASIRLNVGEVVRARVVAAGDGSVLLGFRGITTEAVVRSGPSFVRGDVVELEVLEPGDGVPVFRFLRYLAQSPPGTTTPSQVADGGVDEALAYLRSIGLASPEAAGPLLKLLQLPLTPETLSLVGRFLQHRGRAFPLASGLGGLPAGGELARVLGQLRLEVGENTASLRERIARWVSAMGATLEGKLLRGEPTGGDLRRALLTAGLPVAHEAADHLQAMQLLQTALPDLYLSIPFRDGGEAEVLIENGVKGQDPEETFRVRLRLAVEPLGPVDVRLQLRGSELAVVVATERSDAAEKLDLARDWLAGPLSVLGLRLARLDTVHDPEVFSEDLWLWMIERGLPARPGGGLDIVV